MTLSRSVNPAGRDCVVLKKKPCSRKGAECGAVCSECFGHAHHTSYEPNGREQRTSPNCSLAPVCCLTLTRDFLQRYYQPHPLDTQFPHSYYEHSKSYE